MTWTDDYVQAANCDNCDDDNALKEILFLHSGMTELLVFFFVNSCYGTSRNLKDRLICAANQEARILYASNNSDDATVCNYFITRLQGRDGFLKLPLSLLLWANQQNVEDAHYKDDRQHRT